MAADKIRSDLRHDLPEETFPLFRDFNVRLRVRFRTFVIMRVRLFSLSKIPEFVCFEWCQ